MLLGTVDPNMWHSFSWPVETSAPPASASSYPWPLLGLFLVTLTVALYELRRRLA